MPHKLPITLITPCLVYSFLLLFGISAFGQQGSVVLIHTEGKSSGYGVAYGGPQNLPDRIVTPLHVVAGMGRIVVSWKDKWQEASIEKTYKEADLALLKLEEPLGIPSITLYSGRPPLNTNIDYWEIPLNSKAGAIRKTTKIEEAGSPLSRVCASQGGMSNSLCHHQGQIYPKMSTEILRFGEPNIQKAHSGSPLTYRNTLIGIVDGGTKPANGKSTVWAISTNSITSLFTYGTPPQPMEPCGGVNGSPYMYSGERSDNGWMSPEEKASVAKLEKPITLQTPYGEYLNFLLEYRLSWAEIYESLFDHEKKLLNAHLATEESMVVNAIQSSYFDVYVEETSGINIIIPANAKWVIKNQEFGTSLEVSSPDYTSTMSFYIALTGDINSGLNSMESFQINMAKLNYNVYRDPYAIENDLNNPYRPYYTQKNITLSTDSYGNHLGNTIIKMVVNEGAFFGQVHQIYDLARQQQDPLEQAYYVFFELSMLLSDFKYF